jgi:hypothetical protein
MAYNASVGYCPDATKIDPSQAHTVALRFAGQSLAIKKFTQRRRVLDLDHQVRMLAAICNLYHSVPRGKGYCLNRASLANLHGYVMAYNINTTTTATQKELAHV